MSDLEMVVRTIGATAAFVLALAILNAKDAPWMGRLGGALLCFGVVGYLPCSANWPMCWHPALLPVLILTSVIPFFFWVWTRSITDDDFKFTWPPVTGAAILFGMPLCMVFWFGSARPVQYIGWTVIVHSIIGIAFVIAALIGVLRTWREDLIEARRRLRWIVLVAAGSYSIIVMSFEIYYNAEPASAELQLVNAFALTILLLGICGALVSVSDGVRMAFGWMTAQEPLPLPVQPATVTLRDPEKEITDRMQTLMTDKALYRDATLSVTVLANSLGVQEKRLRAIINGRLGHKNFPSYVNAYRLEEVRLRLVDSRNDHLPILTLALDAGFGSIVVFNRVFKERYAMTPTEYRGKQPSPALRVSHP